MSPEPARPLRVAILADPVWDAMHGQAAGRGDGQAATWLPQFARALLDYSDLEVHWFSLNRRKNPPFHQTLGNLRFIEIPALPVTVDVLAGYRFARVGLGREIRRFAPDVVHAWGTERAYPALLGSLPCPALLSMNGVLGELQNRGVLPDGWRWKLQARLEKQWLRRADIVATESRWASEAVRRMDSNAMTAEVVYGVHPSFYEIQWAPQATNSTLFFAGTLVKGKGVDILVEAMRLLEDSPWKLDIAGDGPLGPVLKADAPSNIRWLGNLGWRDLQHHLSKAWCLVHPTLADSNPNVVKEARVVGLPIITTIHGGQAEYLQHGGNARVLSELSPRNLADAIQEMMQRGLPEIQRSGGVGHPEDRARFLTRNTVNGFREHYYHLAGRTLP